MTFRMMQLKQRLHQTCLANLAAKMTDLQKAIDSIEESKRNETKSSAGDKYETGRAMMQMEADKITAQLELAKQTHSQLLQINLEQHHGHIRQGSLVVTDQRTYFLSVSLGRVVVSEKECFCLSPDAPIGKLLLGKRVGEEIVFNGKKEKILEVY